MKKFLTILSVAAATILSVNAQDATSSSDGGGIGAGNMYLTGTITFNGHTDKDNNGNATSKTYDRVFAPKFGYMVTDNIGVHLTGGYFSEGGDNDLDNDNNGRYTTNGYIVGLGAHYYLPVTEKFYFSPALDFMFTGGTTKAQNPLNNGDYEKTGTSSGFGFALTPNFNYFVGNKWSLNAGWGRFSYETSTSKDVDGNKTGGENDLNIDLDLAAVNMGVTFWIK